MATRKKQQETVLGGDYGEWVLVQEFPPFDKRKCSNCGYDKETFPKDMQKCILTTCPNCGKEMRW